MLGSQLQKGLLLYCFICLSWGLWVGTNHLSTAFSSGQREVFIELCHAGLGYLMRWWAPVPKSARRWLVFTDLTCCNSESVWRRRWLSAGASTLEYL